MEKDKFLLKGKFSYKALPGGFLGQDQDNMYVLSMGIQLPPENVKFKISLAGQA